MSKEPRIKPDFHQFQNIQELAQHCSEFYKKHHNLFNTDVIRERRKKISVYIEKFHVEAGTLNAKIEEKIHALRKGNALILMTAHQPNLFPYSGVMRKATLIQVLEKELERQLGIPVVNFYGFADQDFSDDRWVRSTLLPAIFRKGGVLSLSIDLPEDAILMAIEKPSDSLLKEWQDKIANWVYNAAFSIKSYGRAEGFSQLNVLRERVQKNLKGFWSLVEDAHDAAINYADFNAFLVSRVVNVIWGYNTLFARFSECQRVFNPEFNFLVSHIREYSDSLKNSIDFVKHGHRGGVSEEEPDFLPFWYHCDCGGKARLCLDQEKASLYAYGCCIRCRKKYKVRLGDVGAVDVSPISYNISARAIPMILVFSKGLGLSCYVGGLDGLDYLKEARSVAERLGIVFPPVAIWRPRDVYIGISQLEAMLEYKRITGHFDIEKLNDEMERLKSRIRDIYDRIDKERGDILRIEKQLKEKLIDKKAFHRNIKDILNRIDKIKRHSNLLSLAHDLVILENIPRVLNLIPSIIDYAINIGLKETSDQWVAFLNKKGCLQSDVIMKSVFDPIVRRGEFQVNVSESEVS